ncbi:putative RNA-binding protein P16F5.06 [Cocos nucifera]|uniref:Putative RNA-binding protein P16F5.06 n=1 Tax=Cocos nucifera TaxID=13894 RepID=A0A8K0IJL7_COCNU|nr:putative RNA-binding protein P16F5.06 [Cocos nucifera]
MEGVPDSQVTRVFIGGLSASVTSADIEKTFASLGRVNNVEFVCTNDRSFAFMDFEPNSDKALAKLFATVSFLNLNPFFPYITVSGGKLRLEKAKEHYLARLKREWAEDVKLATAVNLDMKKDAEHLKTSECLNQEKLQFRIFFPKLRKVKTLPFKGTGKHKYSFQRIEVPPLPLHFCDCEEHHELSKTVSQDYLSSLNKVAYEKERSIMTSMMNKLFQEEETEISASGMIKLAKNENTMDPCNNDIQVKETEEIQEADADNLVTNIGMGQSDDMLAQLKGREILSVDQESRFVKLKPFKNKLMRHKAHSQKQQKTALSGASEVVLSQESGPMVAGKTAGDEFTLILPRNKIPEGRQELETVTEAPVLNSQTELERSTVESTRSNSWVQKSSWKDLVGGLGNSSFSISNVLPGISSLETKLPNASDPDTITSAAKKRKVQSEVDGSKSLEVKRSIQQKQDVAPGLVELPRKGDRNKAVVEDGTGEPQENGQQQHKRTIPKVNIGEVCTFMRSAESEKQWTKAKSALSRYLKKKSNENKDSKLSKGMSTHQRNLI